jgi:ABC transport system ATP-binding/permease protein
MNYLTLENVTKTYGEKVLFRNIQLQISKGQKVALVAKNGTGKTTLLRVIAGLEAPEGENCHRLGTPRYPHGLSLSRPRIQ